IPDAEVAPDREVLVDLTVESLHRGRNRQQVEVVEDVMGVDVRERRPFSPASLVGVTVAALRALADHEVGLRARMPCGGDDAEDENGADQLLGAHSVTHWTIAAMSSADRHCAPLSGVPGHPCGMSVPENVVPGAPPIFRTT